MANENNSYPDLRNVPRKDWQKVIDAFNKKKGIKPLQLDKPRTLPRAVAHAPGAKVTEGVDYQKRKPSVTPEELARRGMERRNKETKMMVNAAAVPFAAANVTRKALVEGGKRIIPKAVQWGKDFLKGGGITRKAGIGLGAEMGGAELGRLAGIDTPNVGFFKNLITPSTANAPPKKEMRPIISKKKPKKMDVVERPPYGKKKINNSHSFANSRRKAGKDRGG